MCVCLPTAATMKQFDHVDVAVDASVAASTVALVAAATTSAAAAAFAAASAAFTSLFCFHSDLNFLLHFIRLVARRAASAFPLLFA